MAGLVGLYNQSLTDLYGATLEEVYSRPLIAGATTTLALSTLIIDNELTDMTPAELAAMLLEPSGSSSVYDDFTLYLHAHEDESRSVDLFVRSFSGSSSSTSGINLFLDAGSDKVDQTGDMYLYVQGGTSGYNHASDSFNTFLEASFQSGVNLVVTGTGDTGPTTSGINLIINGMGTSLSDSFDMYLANSYVSDSFDMLLTGSGVVAGAVPNTGSINLYINGPASGSKDIPFVITGWQITPPADPSAIAITDNFDLVMSGYAIITNSARLFIRGYIPKSNGPGIRYTYADSLYNMTTDELNIMVNKYLNNLGP